MFGDINEVTLMGNVTRDPDLRYTSGGTAVLSFSLATNRRYKKGEEWVDEPSFHNITVWNSAETLGQRVKKGTRLIVQGRIQTRSWEDKEGKKQYKTEVVGDRVILVSRYEGANEEMSNNKAMVKESNNEVTSDNDDETIDPNDLPF